MQRPDEPRDEFRGDPETLKTAFAEGVRLAKLDHKRAGVGMVGWEDGRIKVVPPEEIVVDDPVDAASGKDAAKS